MIVLPLERFRQLLDSYGAEPSRWPDDERRAAQALLLDSQPARQLHEEASWIDLQLDAFVVPAPSEALRAAVLRDAEHAPLRAGRGRLAAGTGRGWLRSLWEELGGLRLVGPALATSLAAGIGFSVLLEPLEIADGDEDVLVLAQFGDDFSELLP